MAVPKVNKGHKVFQDQRETKETLDLQAVMAVTDKMVPPDLK